MQNYDGKKLTVSLASMAVVTVIALSVVSINASKVQAEGPKPTPTGGGITPKERMEQNRANREGVQGKGPMGKNMPMVGMMARDDEKYGTTTMWNGTSSMMMFKKDAKHAMLKRMELRTFEIRKNSLIRELNVALRNLDNIDERVKSRITKAEGNNHDMTDAKALLVTAEAKLAKAKLDVKALDDMKLATSTGTTGTTTPNVDLSKPRVLGDAAIKSVKDARDAFKKVVQAIAHALGDEGNASTTEDKHEQNEQ